MLSILTTSYQVGSSPTSEGMVHVHKVVEVGAVKE